MAYELGETYTNQGWTSQIAVVNTGNPYVGYRAFARNKDGDYNEVFDLGQEQLWVDGTNQGAWTRGTHETRESAIDKASAAYRWLNK